MSKLPKGIVYIASGENNLYALNATTGAFKWKYMINPTKGSVRSSPTIANGLVYVRSKDGYL